MNRRIRVLLGCATALGIVGCGDDDDTAPGATTTDALTSAVVSTATSTAVTTTIGGAIDPTTPSPPAAVTTSVSTNAAESTTTVGRVVSSPSENVRQGDTGPGVEQIQQALITAGYDLGVDGIFGPVTDQAVRDFQEENGLTIDGVVGPQTWAKLSEAPAATSTSTVTT